MTKRECVKIIRDLQKDLFLGEWYVVLVPVDAEDLGGDAWARVTFQTHRLEAIMEVAMLRSDDEIKQSVAHELVHLTLTDMREIFYATVDKLAGDDAAKKAVEFMYGEAEERVCHRIARRLVNVYPSDIVKDMSAITCKRDTA